MASNKAIGFTIGSIREASKAGHVVVDVRFDGVNKTYTYIRDISDGRHHFYISGCRVEIMHDSTNGMYGLVSIVRVYDADRGKHKGKKAPEGKITEAIKSEMVEKDIVVPVVEVSEEVQAEPDEEEEVVGPVRHEKYDQIKACIENQIPVYLAGPAGSGKNHTIEQIAEDLDMGFYFSNSIQHEYKLTGFIDAGGKYHETEFYKACTADTECVFFLDEMDASIPDVLVLLNAAIANGYFEFPCGRVEFDHVHFVAAGNTVGNGADDMYTGRMVIDQATLDRFAIIEFDYSIRIEKQITNNNMALIGFIHQLREEATKKGIRCTFSYRCMTMITKLEKSGMDIVVAVKIAIVKGLDKDTINTLNPTGSSKYHKALQEVKAAA